MKSFRTYYLLDFCTNTDIVGELFFQAQFIDSSQLNLSGKWQFANNNNTVHTSGLTPLARPSSCPLAAYPTDARIKCLTLEHVQQLARLHDRPLQSSASSALLDAASTLGSSQEQATYMLENEVEHLPTTRSLPPARKMLT